MRSTRELERRLNRIEAALGRQDMDTIFEVGFRLMVEPPEEGYSPVPVRRAVVERIAARKAESPFEMMVEAWASSIQAGGASDPSLGIEVV